MAGPLDIARFQLQKRTADEMQQMRQLQQQKALVPQSAEAHAIDGTTQSLALMPFFVVTTKKLISQRRANPAAFDNKFRQQLSAYQNRPEDFIQNFWEQYYAAKTPIDRDMAVYFNLGGQVYGQATPAIIAQTGMRPGARTVPMFDPHVPSFNLTPQQSLERARTIYPRMKMIYKQQLAQPLQKDYATRSGTAAVQAAKQEYGKLYTPKDLSDYGIGVFSEPDMPMDAVKIGGRYYSAGTGQPLASPPMKVPLMVSPTGSNALRSTPRVLETPSLPNLGG